MDERPAPSTRRSRLSHPAARAISRAAAHRYDNRLHAHNTSTNTAQFRVLPSIAMPAMPAMPASILDLLSASLSLLLSTCYLVGILLMFARSAQSYKSSHK